MLGKLFRYEMKATGRIILPFYLGLAVLALVCRLSGVFSESKPSGQLGGVVSELQLLGLMVYWTLLVATFVVVFVVMLTRFYKNLYGGGGYLMHALPVTTAQKIWSKALASAVWGIASLAVVLLTALILFLGTDVLDFLWYLWPTLGELWQQLLWYILPGGIDPVSGFWLVILFLEFLALLVFSVLLSSMACYFFLSLGQQMGRHKVLGAFLSYIGFVVVWQLINMVLNISGLYEGAAYLTMRHPLPGLALTFLIEVVLVGGLFFASYFGTYYLMNRKLNLE